MAKKTIGRPGLGGGTLTVTLPPDQLRLLEELAVERRTSKSQVVREALKGYFSASMSGRVRQGNPDGGDEERAAYRATSG